jgi:hypothetical protein
MRIGSPAGRPSTVTTSAGPWDSPAVRKRNTVLQVGRVRRFYGTLIRTQLFVVLPAGRAAPPGVVPPTVAATGACANIRAVI